MPSLLTLEGRRSKRILSRNPRGSLVVNLDRNQKRFPCLVLDSSQDGFRVRGGFHLRRGQIVEVILDADPLNAVRCNVVWIGKIGSKQEGEVGLETV
jgi:PilZ domain-containing protein